MRFPRAGAMKPRPRARSIPVQTGPEGPAIGPVAPGVVGKEARFSMNRIHRGTTFLALLLVAGCTGGGGSKTSGSGAALDQVAAERNLTPDDLLAAAKTYTPSGRLDEYLIFASGGHSGQVFVIGVPSMRLLRSIAVFTPEPWQGWGYGAGNDVIAAGYARGNEVTWGDTHHPALSETAGDYDGQFCFINDKANARVGVIDLRDFETKQIVKNPIAINDHGGAFVTPDTEYVIEAGQYGTPLGWDYAPIEDYKDSYRGMVTLWKFDRAKGRIDESKSFALELPPYWQDLFDAGKLASDGFIFGNCINTELATGGIEKGNPPFEAGTAQAPVDYLHIVDWRKAEAAFAAGKFERVKGFPVIKIPTLVAERILFFAPEPKSPHGVDVAPKGDFIVVAGKLDPHISVYSIEKIKAAIAAESFPNKDAYGIPILDQDAVVEAQVELGLGPLHTQFDDKGYAYTSLFLDTAVARWTLGGAYDELNADQPWTLVAETPVQYNIGHLTCPEGDTVSPDGRYCIALNKWSVDRFFPPGPLLPQNFQLLDISQPGDKVSLLYDMPMGVGEPHYAQTIKADKVKPWKTYPQVGWDPHTQSPATDAAVSGKEGVVRAGRNVDVYMTAVRSHYVPEHVELRKGDRVRWHITSLEQAEDATHGFALPAYNVNLSLEPGESATFEFTANQEGTFTYYCTEFCSALHLEMMGYLMIRPS
jgi:nitrous-oxide reductase